MSYVFYVGVDLYEYIGFCGYGEDVQWFFVQDGQFFVMKNFNIYKDICRFFEMLFVDVIVVVMEDYDL